MAGLEDMIRSSAQGRSIAKPLMMGLLALLASSARKGEEGGSMKQDAQPTAGDGNGGLLGGLGVPKSARTRVSCRRRSNSLIKASC